MMTKIAEPDDERSAAEKMLTCFAYRPKTKDWEPRIMADVAELARMRTAGEKMPELDDLPAWRKARASQLGQF